MSNRRSVLAVAATVWDQDELNPSDELFLDAISQANSKWREALDNANQTYGGGSEAWMAVRNLAGRQRDQEYAMALAEYDARDDEILQLAAE